jgi:hypothetical protein
MILIFNEDDIRKDIEAKDIRKLNVFSFRFINRESLMSADMILFVDNSKKVLRILKHRYVSDYDGVYPSSDLIEILNDYMNRTNTLGKSTLIPGTNKKRQ